MTDRPQVDKQTNMFGKTSLWWFKPFSTCWSVGKTVVEAAVRKLCQLCAARVTWYSFHSYTSDAALLCSQCRRGRCPNVPNGHTHAAKFATGLQRQIKVKSKKETGETRNQWQASSWLKQWKGP